MRPASRLVVPKIAELSCHVFDLTLRPRGRGCRGAVGGADPKKSVIASCVDDFVLGFVLLPLPLMMLLLPLATIDHL